jgi:dihydrofolate reductase
VTAAIVVAAADNDVVGVHGDLPWRIRADLQHFRQLTMGHALLVGRVTYESILRMNGGPLAGRHTVVLTRHTDVALADGVTLAHTLDDAWEVAEKLRANHGQDRFFVAGGAQVYAETLPRVDQIFLTRVHRSPAGDASMPAGWLDGFAELTSTTLDGEDGRPICTFVELAREA